jgi:Protein of unknown function (DUF3224)
VVDIHVTETFTGDIEGDGVVHFVQAAGPDGSASFVGITRVPRERRRQEGQLSPAGPWHRRRKGAGRVVRDPRLGHRGAAGLRGDGGLKAELGQHTTIWLD